MRDSGLFALNQPIFDKCSTYVETRELVFISKMFQKHMWNSNILSKDAGQWPSDILKKDVSRWPASLLKISLFHRYFSHVLLVKTNYLVRP